MKMWVVVESRSEGVLHNDYVQAHTILCPRPLLDHGGAQRWQVMLEVAMGPEDWPECVGHGQDDSDEGHIRQSDPLFPLPESCATITTAGAALRFTGVVEDPLAGGGGVDLPTQGRCTADRNLAEVGSYRVALGGAIPLVPGQFEDFPQGMFRVPQLGPLFVI
jgi:hypothetical protein